MGHEFLKLHLGILVLRACLLMFLLVFRPRPVNDMAYWPKFSVDKHRGPWRYGTQVTCGPSPYQDEESDLTLAISLCNRPVHVVHLS